MSTPDGAGALGSSIAHAAGGGRLAARAEQLQRDSGSADAAQRFEELLATLLVKELRRALPEGLFGEGPGADVYEGWFDEQMGRALARDGGLGLAGIVQEGLVRKAAAMDAAGGL
jgi:Rod binding domain-containing protein